MSSKITQVFRRTVFPTHFVTYRAQCLRSPRPVLFYSPLSRTIKTWTVLDRENKSLKEQLEVVVREREVAETQPSIAIRSRDDIEYELLKKKLDQLEAKRERKAMRVETTGENLRRWTVNSAIRNKMRNNVYFVDLEETNIPLLDMILRGEFVALYGARASGKSTRVFQVAKKLESRGIVCIYVPFQKVDMENDEARFWLSLGTALYIGAPKYFGEDDVKSADNFLLKLRNEQWNNNRVVLFFDEFDELLKAHDNIRSSFFKTIRAIKDSEKDYALLSSVAIGPFSILHLSSGGITTSPFNVTTPFRNPNFTLEQVQTVYKEFENDFKLTIDPEIIEDIYNRTNGHASLVCLCGKVINSHLMTKLDENRRLSSLTWLNFVVNSNARILGYSDSPFSKMITILTEKKEAKPAVKLLRSTFLGSFDFVTVTNPEDLKLAEFLTAEGVLLRDETNTVKFRMSSIFVDDLIRQKVIPVLYKSAPICAIPKKEDNTLDTLKVLQTAIQFFDKDIISNASFKSFKVAHKLYVDGEKKKRVPRESVYDQELYKILSIWLARNNNLGVTGQYHIVGNRANKKKDMYSDIVITTEHQKIVIEILATATKKDLDDHFERVLEYAEKLSADDIWIVHFTCEDCYATHEKLHWPYWATSDRINVIHCFHNRTLEKVLMNVRYVDSSGTIKYITNEAVSLKS